METNIGKSPQCGKPQHEVYIRIQLGKLATSKDIIPVIRIDDIICDSVESAMEIFTKVLNKKYAEIQTYISKQYE